MLDGEIVKFLLLWATSLKCTLSASLSVQVIKAKSPLSPLVPVVCVLHVYHFWLDRGLTVDDLDHLDAITEAVGSRTCVLYMHSKVWLLEFETGSPA